MLDRVQAAIADHHLIAPGDHIVVAVSGGADSVALARGLAGLRDALGCTLSLVHLHHGIRGAEADADEAFVRRLADARALALDVLRADVPAAAEAGGISLEMAARDARLHAYREALRMRAATAVATGHTRDDHIETVLLRLLRGSSTTGLAGIHWSSSVRGVRLIRPMLGCSRDAIEGYLQSLAQPFRRDTSNRDDRFLRNRIRHELLPMLRDRFNPAVDDALHRATRLLEQDEAVLVELAAEAGARCRTPGRGLDVTRLSAEPPALAGRLVKSWLMEAGIPGELLDQALMERIRLLATSIEGSASVPLPGGDRVERVYQALRVCREVPLNLPAYACTLAIPGETVMTCCGLRATAVVEPAQDPRRPGTPGVFPVEACLNRVRIGEGPLVLRSRRPGDRMRPLGLGGTVTLQDVFVDAKVPRDLRARIPVCTHRDEITWVPGYQVAEGWQVHERDSHWVRIRIEALTDDDPPHPHDP